MAPTGSSSTAAWPTARCRTSRGSFAITRSAGELVADAIRQRWQRALSQHLEGRKQYGEQYLGTLLVSEDYNLSVGTVKFTHVDNIVQDTGENPRIQELGRYFVNTGTAILKPGILAFIERGDASLHGDAVRRALASLSR
jgi:hypothetical protein